MRNFSIRKFTLIELIAVVAVIAVLAGLLMPALSKAKASAANTVCRNNLRQLGFAVKLYAEEYHGILPIVGVMKSINPELPTLREVLLPFAGGEEKLFECPADFGVLSARIDDYTSEELDEVRRENSGDHTDYSKSDFQLEESSYEFNVWLCGRPVNDRSRSMLMHDYRPYHGEPGKPGAANYLFADGHVGDLTWR